MRAALLLTPVVLVVAACGGGGSGVSKADYVKKAEAICSKANKDVDALSVPTDPAGLPAYVKGVVDIADTATTELADLEAPSKDEPELKKRVLEPLRTQVVQARDYSLKVRRAVDSHDQVTLARLIANPPTETKADLSWMRSYGFKECVKAADTSD